MLPVFVADKVSMAKRRTPERAEGGSGRQRFPSRPAKEEFLNVWMDGRSPGCGPEFSKN